MWGRGREILFLWTLFRSPGGGAEGPTPRSCKFSRYFSMSRETLKQKTHVRKKNSNKLFQFWYTAADWVRDGQLGEAHDLWEWTPSPEYPALGATWQDGSPLPSRVNDLAKMTLMWHHIPHSARFPSVFVIAKFATFKCMMYDHNFVKLELQRRRSRWHYWEI